MASQWYFRSSEDELGPVSFGELTDLVRNGTLTEADLVRPTWKQDWQRADSVVGLFYMVHRPADDLVTHDADAGSVGHGVPPVGVPPSGGSATPMFEPEPPELEQSPSWMTRLWSLPSARSTRQLDQQSNPQRTRAPFPPHASVPPPAPESEAWDEGGGHVPAATPNRTDEPLAPETFTAWSRTIDAALRRADLRSAATRPGRLNRALNKLALPFTKFRGISCSPWLRPAFRITCALIGAILIALAIEAWSSYEALRFPSADPQLAALRPFPLLGKCAPAIYFLSIVTSMLISGAAAYLAARWLDSRAE